MIIDAFAGDGGVPDDPAFDMDEFAVDYEMGNDPAQVDLEELCREFFAPGGTLFQASAVNGSPCEERPQQLAMACAVSRALKSGGNLCVEAPTGVGKSFAYLLPLIHYAVNRRRPVLISTETINLQHQLIEKDLPFLQELTGVEFQVALAKGRSNYLCRRRLAMLSGEQRDMLLPVPQMVLDVEKIIHDLESGRDDNYLNGIRENSRIWHMVCSESGNCAGPKCEFYRNCYYYRARRKWDAADIVVANHALFLTDLAIRQESGGGGTLLPDYAAVMIDEAHTLENNAAAHLGLHLSKSAMIGLMNRLYNPERTRGLLMHPGEKMPELRALAQFGRDEVYGFFVSYEKLLEEAGNSACRLDEHVPDAEPSDLLAVLDKLGSRLSEIAENCDDDNFRTEISSNGEKCRLFADMIRSFVARLMEDAVYFVEKEAESISCCASPLNVSQLLRELLFNGDLPVLLCSATLTVAGKFDYFLERTGFTGGEMLELDSPFSADQAKLLLKKSMPEPDSPDYNSHLARVISEMVIANGGNAFVLFTSYQSMKACQQLLSGEFALHGLPLLVQGDGIGRSEMLRTFQSVPGSVLFGTDSFWTGVDVPGESLTLVIITRLPFASIGSPLTSARMEKLEAAGKSSFAHYSLPEAVLKFRQGAGRLIRTRRDRGVIAVLDPRIITRRYGRNFINSLPYSPEIID